MGKLDCVVIGGGGVGGAAMYHLARKGAHVLGIDRFHPPHGLGSSHGHTRIIRNAYFEHPDYVPLLRRAYTLWRDLEAEVGGRLFDEIGLIEAGPPQGVLIPGVRRAESEHGCAVESLDHDEVRRRFPAFTIPEDHEVVFEAQAGQLHVEACVDAHLTAARRAGATLRTDTVVRGVEPDGEGVKVILDDEVITADRAVITAGAWSSRLLGHLSVPLRVVHKSLFWYAGADPRLHIDSGCPVFAFETDAGFYYGFPRFDDQGVKLAEHGDGALVTDPARVNRDLDEGARRRVDAFSQAYLQTKIDPYLRHAVCMYTMSPDEHFIVDTHPRHPQVVFAAGLSGHGFKFASVLGEVLAELAVEGATARPIEFLRIGRFAEV